MKSKTPPSVTLAPPAMAKLPDAEKWHGISPATISPSGHPIARMPDGVQMVGRVDAGGTVYHEPLNR